MGLGEGLGVGVRVGKGVDPGVRLAAGNGVGLEVGTIFGAMYGECVRRSGGAKDSGSVDRTTPTRTEITIKTTLQAIGSHSHFLLGRRGFGSPGGSTEATIIGSLSSSVSAVGLRLSFSSGFSKGSSLLCNFSSHTSPKGIVSMVFVIE